MNSIAHSQLRFLPPAARRIARARYPQPRTASKRHFHISKRLHSTDAPHDVPSKGTGNAQNKKLETFEAGNGAIGHAATPPQQASSASNTQDGDNLPGDSERAQQASSFHGSASRRSRRNLPRKKAAKSQVAPDWFLEHNIHLRSTKSDEPWPGIEALQRHRNGYSSPIRTDSEDHGADEAAAEKKPIPVAQMDLKTKRDWKPLTEADYQKFQDDFKAMQPDDGRPKFALPPLLARKWTDLTGGDNSRVHGLGRGMIEVREDMSRAFSRFNSEQSVSPRSVDCLETPDQPRYFLDVAQASEILSTARGLMKLPPEGSQAGAELSVQKAHLFLHYPATGGDVFLDALVHKVAAELNADLVVLDAQDIAELIVQEDINNEVSTEARSLSYEVYGRDEDEAPEFPQPAEAFGFGENEDGEEPGRPPENHFGTPIMIGRPITLNLSQLIQPSRSIKGSSRPGLPKAMRELFGVQHQHGSKLKFRSQIFAPLVNKILSAAERRREARKSSEESSNLVKNFFSSSSTPAWSDNGFILHIRDLKAIQDNSLGSGFLHELYEQVQNRRMSRERIMLIGTESATDDLPGYDRARLQEIQKHEMEEISRSIVVTPVTPNSASKIVFLEDKKKRTAAINLRHLWTMITHKSDVPLYNLQPGFWNSDLTELVSTLDFECLRDRVWSFGHTHRMATLLLGNEQSILSKENNDIFKTSRSIAASDETKWEWAKESGQGRVPQFIPGGLLPKPENSRLAGIRNTATKYEKRLLGGVIEPDKITTTFNDVHAPLETIDALQTLTTLSLVRPDAFKYGVLASDRIPGLLLYGPPGTGKTLLAKAVAKESGSTVLEASAADINDMYVGEGEKNVQALFSLAKKLSPCVVFLDEADAMFSARGMSSKRVSHRELLNQFLKEWDGMSNDSGSAFLMVATNRPMDLDDAVLRRLPRRLLVDLPSEADRLEILKIHLRNEVLGSDVSLNDLATQTPFYSGSDLKNVAVAAALNCVREENELAKNYKGEEPYKHAEKRTLTAKHFMRALEEITASISEDMSSLREIKKFDEQYGDRRGRKKRGAVFGFKNAKEADKVLDTVKVRA